MEEVEEPWALRHSLLVMAIGAILSVLVFAACWIIGASQARALPDQLRLDQVLERPDEEQWRWFTVRQREQSEQRQQLSSWLGLGVRLGAVPIAAAAGVLAWGRLELTRGRERRDGARLDWEQRVHQNERYANAVRMLESADSSTRVGGVVILGLLAAERPEFGPPVAATLSPFFKSAVSLDQKASMPLPSDSGVNDPESSAAWRLDIPADALAALGVLSTVGGAQLSHAALSGIAAPLVSLDQANLAESDLSRASLLDAGFRGACMARANLSNADFSRGDFTGADLRQSNAAGLVVEGAILDGCNLVAADLTGAELANCRMTGAQLDNAVLEGASLASAQLEGSTFVGARLRNAYLGDADLRGGVLERTDLVGASLAGAMLDNASLRNADLRGATLAGSSLRHADLRSADLRGAVLSGCEVTGARWHGSKLEGAVFVGVDGGDVERAQSESREEDPTRLVVGEEISPA